MTDYDRHYTKHSVRLYGWLPACKDQKKRTGKQSLKYFTLCAREALDVFMLESAKILRRDTSGKLPDVVICEEDETAAADIFKLVRPPLKEAMIVGPLEEILTFEDTNKTKGLSLDEDVKDQKIRRLLRFKRLFNRLKEHFPFDVVNFDTYGSLLNPDHHQNKLYQAFSRVFELQKGIDSFLLLVTSPVSKIHRQVQARFEKNFESNLTSYGELQRALLASVGTVAYNKIDTNKRIAIDTAKCLIIAEARRRGWCHEHKGVFVYQSPGGHRMLSSVVRLSKAGTRPDESSYIRDLVRVVRDMPKYFSWNRAKSDNVVREHLSGVIRYREQIRNELTG